MNIQEDIIRFLASAVLNLAMAAFVFIAGRIVSKILAGALEKLLQRSKCRRDSGQFLHENHLLYQSAVGSIDRPGSSRNAYDIRNRRAGCFGPGAWHCPTGPTLPRASSSLL